MKREKLIAWAVLSKQYIKTGKRYKGYSKNYQLPLFSLKKGAKEALKVFFGGTYYNERGIGFDVVKVEIKIIKK